MNTENANARSKGPSKGSRSGRNSLRANVAGRATAQDLQDLLGRIAPKQRAGFDVAGKEAGQAAPAAPEVEHARVGQRTIAMLAETLAQLRVERNALAASAMPLVPFHST